jgi:hypothetical protein
MDGIYHTYTIHIPKIGVPDERSAFQVGSCDIAAADDQSGSNVYEVNQWLWQFGRGKPHLGGLSVEKTDDRKEAALKELSLPGAETSRCCKTDWA